MRDNKFFYINDYKYVNLINDYKYVNLIFRL
jgi:hypothetical protein